MPTDTFEVRLTTRQAEALRCLAAREELPPEVYAAEVLTKHLYHNYTPESAPASRDRPARNRHASSGAEPARPDHPDSGADR